MVAKLTFAERPKCTVESSHTSRLCPLCPVNLGQFITFKGLTDCIVKPIPIQTMKQWYSLLMLALGCVTLHAQEAQLIREPAVSPDGQQLAFAWQGDIWVADIDGSNPTRLTIHESYETNPTWSPDGQTIVFEGYRYGNSDLYRMSATGQQVTRLTYHSATDADASIDAAGQLYFATRRAFATVEREYEVHQMPLAGGTPHRYMDALGLMPSVSPDGRYIAYIRGTCRAEREAYTGPANRNIWLYDTQKRTYQPVANHDYQETQPVWAGNRTLCFLSAANGRYNVHQVTIGDDGRISAEKPLTSVKKMGIRSFSISADGKTLAYESGNSIYVIQGGKSRKLSIQVPQDDRFDPIAHENFTSGISDFSLSANGKYHAFLVRGEIFVGEADKEKSRAVNISNHPYRESNPLWLNDSTLLFTSDRGGNYDIYRATSSDTGQVDLFRTFKREIVALTNTAADESDLTLSPDGKQLAYIRGLGDLVVRTVEDDGTLGDERVLLEGWNGPNSLSWSPDSKYLAFSRSDLDFNSEIYIMPADGSRSPANVSMHPRGDYDPVWSPDGSKLAFLSIRNNGNSDVWFVWLKKSDWEKTQNDWEDGEDDSPKGKKGKDTPQVTIDWDGLHERLVQVTYLPGNEGNIAWDEKGEMLFFNTNTGSRAGSEGVSDFKKVKWNGEGLSTVLPKTRVYRLQLNAKEKTLHYLVNGRIQQLKTSSSKPTSFRYNAKMDIDRMAEMRQIFDEAWRVINDGFYDPNFHGQNWNQLRTQYEALALSASTIQDFRTVFNEMLGQLNASHMGLRGSDVPESVQRERTGLLGIELKPTANGLEITRVVMGTPADRHHSQLRIGDRITAINGTPITAVDNFYRHLEGTAGQEILLQVTNQADEMREVVIRPTSSIRDELYNMWVKERQELTHQYSGGKLGYIHIQGMNWPSFERFERELTAAGLGKAGIVIDVRYNGGGWTTDMLMAVLNVKQHAYTVPRGAVKSLEKENKQYTDHYPYGERLPLAAWTKPAIALCNQNSYSNAEIFSHAFKTLDRGTLVGMPTFGAVISTGAGRLIDGSYVRRPFRAWYVKATGENMEHGPAVPDIELENAPDYRVQDDAQLQKAVKQLLGELK